MYHGNAIFIARFRPSHRTLSHLYQTTHLKYACSTGARAMATSTKTETITKRDVAGSFIFKIPNGDVTQAKVALFRRSSKVRTYQHKLAPCSGSVEQDDASPLDAALREIREETTLPASSVELLRVGKPYSFIDEKINREWNINPFAFRLKDVAEGGKGEEGISLDWEHENIEWHDPLQVSDSEEFGGVPKLVNSLRRVWPEYDLGPEAGRILTEGMQKLRDDHERGARELASMAVSTLRDVVHQMSLSHSIYENWWANIRMAAWHLCQTRPSMGAAITRATIKALSSLEPIYNADIARDDKIRQMAQELETQISCRGSTISCICTHFAHLVQQHILRNKNPHNTVSILTLSSSSTILESLRHAIGTLDVTFDLRILESRPLCEGVTLASKLTSDLPPDSPTLVTIYSDASVALAARGVDFVVLGADRVSSAGDVSNKIGSLPAVLAAKYVNPNVKIIVLSDTEKIAAPGSMEEHRNEENSVLELSQAWKGTVKGADDVEAAISRDDSNVAVKNTYFEWVPAELIDEYVTEEGLWTTDHIKLESGTVEELIERYFKNL
ncbi:hypothetical protein F4860DRAFT_466837 [Xylaria cubensis]|nr:hypothetical protein F4860DRAFT_466837 [Xylaria cubensis]